MAAFFYVACLLVIIEKIPTDVLLITCAWVFVIGRMLHSGVQILTTHVRLRGTVFTINFVAVLAMWLIIATRSI